MVELYHLENHHCRYEREKDDLLFETECLSVQTKRTGNDIEVIRTCSNEPQCATFENCRNQRYNLLEYIKNKVVITEDGISSTTNVQDTESTNSAAQDGSTNTNSPNTAEEEKSNSSDRSQVTVNGNTIIFLEGEINFKIFQLALSCTSFILLSKWN